MEKYRPHTPQEAARTWLIENDPEAADYWRNLPVGSDFIGAYKDNIRDFGPEAPLAIPGERYRLTGTAQVIVVDQLAHSPTYQNREMVVYHHLADEDCGGPETAIRYYIPVTDFERNYKED